MLFSDVTWIYLWVKLNLLCVSAVGEDWEGWSRRGGGGVGGLWEGGDCPVYEIENGV